MPHCKNTNFFQKLMFFSVCCAFGLLIEFAHITSTTQVYCEFWVPFCLCLLLPFAPQVAEIANP